MTFTSAIAGERVPFGSPVRIEDDLCFVAPAALAHGVTMRPPTARDATYHERGESARIKTEGGVLADIGGAPQWVELRAGKIQSPRTDR